MKIGFSLAVFSLAVPLLLPFASALSAAVPVLNPSAAQVAVRNASELVAALGNAKPGQTLMLADGTYDVSAVEPLRIRVDSVGLYGASRDPAKVVLKGQGFGGSNTDEEMIKIEATHSTLAYLTIRDVRSNGLKIQSGGNTGLLVHNVDFIDICERSIKGPDAPVSLGGIVRYCLFEQVTPITAAIPNLNFDGDYIAGMDMMKIDGWRIHDNTFKNIRGMHGGGRAGVFLWNGCKNVVVERNLFIGCDRAIAFGNPSGPVSEMEGGSIRNNFIVAGAGIAIEVCHSTASSVYHNTVYSANPSFSRTFSFFANASGNTSGNAVKNNLVLGHLSIESGTAPDTAGNLFVASAPGWFQSPAAGDLHLSAAATAAIDKGVPLPEITDDFDGLARAGIPDIGADEIAPVSAVSGRGKGTAGRGDGNPGMRPVAGYPGIIRNGARFGWNGRKSCWAD
jgi:hypothetical protein